MKVNLKKIGAIVAGATILASSAAFAGLMFGSTTLVDANGAPVAKVVVGSNAAASDGVAAALIANKIVSAAWKQQTLTAQVSGQATCATGSAGNSTNSTGTCSVTNKQVQLQITVPGATAAGTYTFSNLIGDFLNRRLIDREDNFDATNADQGYSLGGSDTSDNANPFTDGAGGSIGPTQQFMYRISGALFSTFADQTLTDSDSGNTYVEHQDMWISGNNRYDSDPKTVVGNVDFLAYTLKFDGPGSNTDGIPECTRADNLDFADCKSGNAGLSTTIDDATETHRMQLSFLGQTWIISGMTAPVTPVFPALGGLTTDNTLKMGGEVKLAKESVAGILNQGESLPVDNLKFQLDDLEAHGNVASAIIEIQDANGNVLQKDNIPPGETKDYQINGKDYKFHVYKVAPGYTFGAKWADVAIFSDELKLDDGQKLDADNGKNNGWKVSLGWKNLDAQSGAATGPGLADPQQPDALRTIVLYSDSPEQISSSGDSRLNVGDYLKIVQDPVSWQLTYNGLNLQSSDMSTLKFEVEKTNLAISQSEGPLLETGNTVRSYCLLIAPYVKVTSSDSGSVFQVGRTDGTGTLADSEFLVAMNTGPRSGVFSDAPGTTNSNGALCDVTDTANTITTTNINGAVGTFFAGTVFMKESPSSTNYGMTKYVPTPHNANALVPAASSVNGNGYMDIQYQKIGDGDNTFSPSGGGDITFQEITDVYDNDGHVGELLASSSTIGGFSSGVPGGAITGVGTNQPTMVFGIAEKAGTDTSNSFVDYYTWGLGGTGTTSVADASFNIDDQIVGVAGTKTFDSSNTKALYGHATNQASNTNTPFYCSGTVVYGLCAGLSPTNTGIKTGPVDSGLELVDAGHTSERGSQFRTRDSGDMQFNMADKLGEAQWFLAPTTTNSSSANTNVVTLAEGASTTIAGVTVMVMSITEDVGACSAATGAVSCTTDMSPVSAVIMPNNAPSVSVAMPYTGDMSNLVILDTDAVGVNTLISVGGDKVNSVTAQLLQGSPVDWTATPQVVREVVQGSKIVVAGAQASDTLAAAQTFISQLKQV